MVIKTKKTWKDLIDRPAHPAVTRRDLLLRGLATGAMSVALPRAFFGDFVKTAMAAPGNCPPPSRPLGSIAQIFSEGGPTMGARFIGDAQAAAMNATMAKNYGISGQTNLVKIGPNLNVDATSPFGFALLQGPPGYPGGAAAWRSNVLSKVSGGGHLGPFNADDGAGANTGLVGSVSPFKNSQMGKDLALRTSVTVASWSNGAPTALVRGTITQASLANTFSLTPAANGLTNADALNAASDGANALAQALDPVFNNSKRKFASQLLASAGCAFYGNSALADPNYGKALFDVTNISALAPIVTVANLSEQEKALASAYYQSAAGVAGGVLLQFGGRDYHGANANTIGTADVEEARAIVMFLAACEAAGAPGAMIYVSNGQAIANGVQTFNTTINGANATLNAATAVGDAGGAYNAGLIIFFDPKGSPPMARMTGKLDTLNGNATTESTVGSSQNAMAGLFLSAHKWVNGGTLPQTVLSKIQAAGVANTPGDVLVI